MRQESELDDLKLLYIQWLIVGLDTDMTTEIANEIIFPKEANQYYKVGEFNVGIVEDSKDFTFKAVPY